MWDSDGGLTLYDATQGSSGTAGTLAGLFGLEPEQVHVIASHVGGGFGSKGTPRPHVVRRRDGRARGRPRGQGRDDAAADVPAHRVPHADDPAAPARRRARWPPEAIAHDVVEQTSTVDEFAEQTAVATRMMYAAATRRTTHRLVALDVPTPSWMRAPGETPGHVRARVGDGRARRRVRPRSDRAARAQRARHRSRDGAPFSSRNLVGCLREGAASSAGTTATRSPAPGATACGWSAPAWRRPPTRRGAAPRRRPRAASADGTFTVRVAATDIGTGARTVLTQIAADALGRRAGAGPRRDRRLLAAEGARRRRLDGDGVLGLGRRQGVPAAARGPRCHRDARRHDRRHRR